MKLPSFDVDIRDYPRFKSDFQRQVLPGLKKPETAAYVSKSCFSKSPFNMIRTVDDNLDEMWNRLSLPMYFYKLLSKNFLKPTSKNGDIGHFNL